MRSLRVLISTVSLAFVAVVSPVVAQVATPETAPVAAAPPTRPASGPGGADYRYEGVVATAAEQPVAYWVFAPRDGSGTASPDADLPLVLVLGGCCPDEVSAGPPDPFQDWIDHLVRRGAVVVYPAYRADSALADVQAVMRAVLSRTDAATAVAVNADNLAIFGTSTGGVVAANYAAAASVEGGPLPSALVIHAPAADVIPLADVSTLPASTRALVVIGSDDEFSAEVLPTAARIWAGLAAVPEENRDYITLIGDDHGQPPLVADHFLPVTATFEDFPTLGTNALDWYGTWKLVDGLLACAVEGRWCEYALGNTPEQRFMGTWSDGVPVQEAIITDDPELAGTPEVATPAA